MESRFGARFDMETDAWLILALGVLVWRYDKAGAWVLLSGALRYLFIAAGWGLAWMRGTLPPPSRYPTLAEGYLVDADKSAMAFPTLPGLPPSLPSNFIMPVLDYDFGPKFNYLDGSGVPTVVPPRIKRILRMLVPRVDADGNENVTGVHSPLLDAPLGTYMGWNVTASGAYAGQICSLTGGFMPFEKTAADRAKTKDPRPSIEERYGDRQGYVCAVKKAVDQSVKGRYMLEDDGKRLIDQATTATAGQRGAREESERVSPSGEDRTARSRHVRRLPRERIKRRAS